MSVMSIDTSRICSMSLAVLQRLMSEYSDVQIRCYELLSKMISEEQAFISMLSRGDAERRLAFILLRICRNRCSMDSDRLQFSVPMTRSEACATCVEEIGLPATRRLATPFGIRQRNGIWYGAIFLRT